MTTSEKVSLVQSLLDDDEEATDAVVENYLALAKQKILDRLYPFGNTLETTDIPARYDRLHCELSVRLYLRRGGEGEESHEENGVNRTWASVDDEDILSRLTPFAVVM